MSPGSAVVGFPPGVVVGGVIQAADAVALAAQADNVLANASVTLTTGATLLGRAFAQVGAVTLDANIITLADCANVEGPDVQLDLTKTDSPDPVIAGKLLTYVLTVTIVVRVCSDLACGTILVNTAVASADFGLPDPVTTGTTVGTQSDLSIVKTQTGPAGNLVIAGQNLTYQIVVTNVGPSNSPNTVMANTLPLQTNIVSASPTQGSRSALSAVVSCGIGALGHLGGTQCNTGTPLPSQVTITIVILVPPDTPSSKAAAPV